MDLNTKQGRKVTRKQCMEEILKDHDITVCWVCGASIVVEEVTGEPKVCDHVKCNIRFLMENY